MMDEKGRVWFTSRVRPNKNPDWCKGAEHPSAKAFPLAGEANRHLSMYDPKTGKWTLISTCFPTHHLNFARDADQTLWTSSGVAGPGVVGWLNRRLYEKTGDEAKAQGWTALVLDTNGNGKRDEYVEPDQPVDPAKDKRVGYALYAVAVSPADGTIWGTATGNRGDSISALVDGELLTCRLPYPSGLFPKNVDGRIDDPKAGWKGRALWTTSGTRTLFHNEGGKEMRHKAVKIQLRPDPLAR